MELWEKETAVDGDWLEEGEDFQLVSPAAVSFYLNPPSIAHELRLGSNLHKIVRSLDPAIAILGVGIGAERNFLAIPWDLSRMLLAALSSPATGANTTLCLACLRRFRLDRLSKRTLVAPAVVDHLDICEPDVVDAFARHPSGVLAIDGRLDRTVVVPSRLLSDLTCDLPKLVPSLRSSSIAGLRDRLDQL